MIKKTTNKEFTVVSEVLCNDGEYARIYNTEITTNYTFLGISVYETKENTETKGVIAGTTKMPEVNNKIGFSK